MNFEKEKHRARRHSKAKHKENDRLRTCTYQRTIDTYKKAWKKKGDGQAHKIKGKVMPTAFCSNSRCAKSWKHLNGNPMQGESMKVAIIFALT